MDNKYQHNFSNAPAIYNELPAIKTDKIEKWLRKEIFNTTRYIFYDKQKNEAVCSFCGSKFEVPHEAKHKQYGVCHKCKSEITFRSAGYSREVLTQRSRMVLFQSKGKSIYVTVNMIYLDFNQGYGQLYKDCEAVYKFDKNTQVGYETSCWWGSSYWTKMTNIRIPYRQGEWSYVPVDVYTENINTVFKNTDLKYCELEKQIYELGIYDFIKVLALNAKHEAIEKLYKIGLRKVISDKMNRRAGTKYIKWNKSNIKEILELNKDEIKKIRELNYGMTNIAVYKMLKAEGVNIKLEDVAKWDFSEVYKIRSIHVGTFNGKWKYLNKQYNQLTSSKKNQYYQFTTLLQDYVDYIGECKTLNFNLSDEMIIYPKNLLEAHSRTSTQIEIIANEEKDKQVKKIAVKNKKLNFNNKKLFIKVADSASEIIVEGKILGHCVGGYIQNVIDNKTLILFVRQASEPDTPFYTLELKGKKVEQCRGYKNCSMTDEVKAFVDKWHKEVVMKKDKKQNKQLNKKVKAVA